jgi:hypothetical protein
MHGVETYSHSKEGEGAKKKKIKKNQRVEGEIAHQDWISGVCEEL